MLPIISVLAENTLLKTACHFLLLLVGFDTLTYRNDYDRSPILVGHHEVAYILSIKIYRDRSRRLISFFNKYIPWQDFEVVQYGIVKERVSCLCYKVWSWVGLKTRPRQKIERMKVIPYASAIGSIKYAMLCTRSIVYPTLILAREYNSDLGVDHWTAVKIILRGLRKYFSVMEVIKSSS